MNVKLVALLLGVTTGLSATAAIAATSGHRHKPVPATLADAPVGYTIRSGRPVQSPANSITRASVSCPGHGRDVLLGGGVFVLSVDPLVRLIDSYPGATPRWLVRVDNGSDTATSYTVYAVCADQSAASFVRSGNSWGFDALSHRVTSANLNNCPGGVNLMVNGLHTLTTDDAMTLHGSRPTPGPGWRISVNSSLGHSYGVEVWELCVVLRGVEPHLVTGPPVQNPPLTQSSAAVTCDTGVPLAGGIGADSSSPHVSVSSSGPIPGGWRATEDNESLHLDTITAYVLCS
jgi:hypothetical protein